MLWMWRVELLMCVEVEGLVKEGEVLKELLDYALQHCDCELLSALHQDFGVPGVISRPWLGVPDGTAAEQRDGIRSQGPKG